jgi:two-component system, OmpR family, sensor histidine kinase KdpD
MEEHRPDPDRLLEQLRADESRRSRGSLKIFFGYVAGVGKTYAMLEAAQRMAAAGVDVVAGYVEPHERPETEVLLKGLEVLPPLLLEYRGLALRELDLDAALARHPQLLLVDELAHTNAPGARHAKRWEDVRELLGAGINVYTTLNVQHLESLNDVIAQITGVQVKETVPDAVFDDADSVEVVDLPPRELVERLHQGKVYFPAQAERALRGFFTPPNLGALREITLRRTADRVHVHLETARLASAGPRQTWAISETLLVCVGPSPTSAKVIRTSMRMAASLGARWIAVGVESSRAGSPGDSRQQQLMSNIQLAERLGAETATVRGDNIAEEIVSYARSQSVTKIAIGKTAEPRWKRLLGRSILDDLLKQSGDMDVFVVTGGPGSEHAPPARLRRAVAWQGYAWAVIGVAAACLVAWAFQDIGLAEANKAIVFLLAAALVAVRFGLGPGVLATVLGVLAFDFFFVPPYLTFAVTDAQFVITFAVMLVVALIISSLAARLRRQVRTARAREGRLEALYRLSRELSAISGAHQLASAAQREVSSIFGTEVTIYLPDEEGRLEPVVSSARAMAADSREQAVATWAFGHGQLAGNGTDTLPNAAALHVPMITPRGTAGILSVHQPEGEALLSPENRQLLETLATQIGTAIERDRLAEETQGALLQIDKERMRSSLLSSVSHDLRTPLAVIAGASSALLELGESADVTQRTALLEEVVEESNRLARLVDNLLSMTRLDAGAIEVEKQWFPFEDVIGSALGRVHKELIGRAVNKHLAPDLPLIPLDGVLIEQVLVNLLENALRYSGAGSPLDISARVENGAVVVSVGDTGPGLAEGEEERVFEKLFRGSASATSGERGAGLGLAIARAIISAHGGRIWAENRPGGGASFSFLLPLGESPPDLSAIEQEGAQA